MERDRTGAMKAEQQQSRKLWWKRSPPLHSMTELIESDPEYQKAKEFADGYKGKPEVDYGWVYDYTRREYEMVAEAVKGLESKANSVAQYVGGISGILALAGTFSAGRNGWPAILTVPSIFMALRAFEAALYARAPESTPSPPPADYALGFADKEGTTAKAMAKAAAKTAEATAAMRVVARERGARLETARTRIVWALALLLVPLVGGALQTILQQ